MLAPVVPDLIQAVLGYRTWAVDDDGWLLPFSLGAIAGPWRPGVNHATCHYAKWKGAGVRDRHAAPHPRCMCGLYALTDADDPRLPRDDAGLALGAIGAWGDLEVHRDGFRAEYATVLALAVSAREPARVRARHERAARRYGVELVAPELLEVTGLRHAAPVPAALLPGGPGLTGSSASSRTHGRGRPRRGALRVAGAVAPSTPAGRGVRIEDHTWLDAATLRCGITAAFARHLGAGPVDLALPTAGAHHRTSDALAHVTGGSGETLRVWTPLTAQIRTVNPALADDPGLLLRDPEGEGWIATLAPTAWGQEAGGLEWGPRGTAAYRAGLAAPDPWAELRATAVHVRSAEEVLSELRRRRAAPRFADAAAVQTALVAPLAAALAADPAAATRLARLRRRVRFVLTEPDASFVLDARTAPAHVAPAASGPDGARPDDGEPHAAADLTFTLTATLAERFLEGRLDVARALRAGELQADQGPGPTLAAVSVLSGLPPIRSSRRNQEPIRT